MDSKKHTRRSRFTLFSNWRPLLRNTCQMVSPKLQRQKYYYVHMVHVYWAFPEIVRTPLVEDIGCPKGCRCPWGWISEGWHKFLGSDFRRWDKILGSDFRRWDKFLGWISEGWKNIFGSDFRRVIGQFVGEKTFKPLRYKIHFSQIGLTGD